MLSTVLLAESANSPQHNPIGRHVRQNSEDPVINGLNSHPLDWESASGGLDVGISL